MAVETRGARDKWAGFWATYERSAYASAYGMYLYELEAAAAGRELAARAELERVLSLGTGLGQVELALLPTALGDRRLLAAAELDYPVLEQFAGAAAQAPGACVVAPTNCDAYALPYADAAFDAVISFGNACVASYRGMAGELARVVRPGGMVIMDFVNHLSAYSLVRAGNWRRFLLYAGVLGGGEKYHHYGRLGIKAFYRRHGLELQRLHHLAPAVPARNALTTTQYHRLDRWWPLSPLFARVLLGVFERV